MTSKGQLGSSFQWIFVIIAGGAFLIFFFVIIRACAQSGEDRIEALSLFAAGEKMRAAVWQGNTIQNISVEPSYVSCPTGSAVTLQTISGSTPISMDDAPVFLPPELSGRLTLVSREAVLGEETESPILLGGVLYGIDENTYYFVIQDIGGQYREVMDLLPDAQNINLISIDEAAYATTYDVPNSATTVVIVAPSTVVALENIPLPEHPERVLGVALNEKYPHGGGEALFYEREGDRFVQTGEGTYVTRHLGAGAMIAGTTGNYRCAQESFTERLRYMTLMLEARAKELSTTPELSALCKTMLNGGMLTLGDINSQPSDDAYRVAFSQLSWKLMNSQIYLLDSACPVIS